MSIARSKHEMQRQLQPIDFEMKEKFSIVPRLTNILDSRASRRVAMTRFVDYAPLAFQKIRASFGIHDDEYVASIGPEQLLGNMVLGNLSSLAELSSEGKSGSFFYHTADGKYMLKTISHKEYKHLKLMLRDYVEYISQNSSTLLVRFFGLHCLSTRARWKTSGGQHTVQKIYFVVMANMFNTPFDIPRRYDLKGSWVGRVTTIAPDQRDPSVALKDVDFYEAGEKVSVGDEVAHRLLRQIEADCDFLRRNNVIDYSLLLGVHDVLSSDQHLAPSPVGNINRSPVAASEHDSEAGAQASLSNWADGGGVISSDGKAVYFLGIIDILTSYDSRKKLEHIAKAVLDDRHGVSCCEPNFYAERFSGFMRGVGPFADRFPGFKGVFKTS